MSRAQDKYDNNNIMAKRVRYRGIFGRPVAIHQFMSGHIDKLQENSPRWSVQSAKNNLGIKLIKRREGFTTPTIANG